MKLRGLFLLLLISLMACYPASEDDPIRMGLDVADLGFALTGDEVQSWVNWLDADLAQFDMNRDGSFFMSLGLVDADGQQQPYVGFTVSFVEDDVDGQQLIVEMALDACQDCHFELTLFFNYELGSEFIGAWGASQDFTYPGVTELEFDLQRTPRGQVILHSAGDSSGDFSLYDTEFAVRFPKETLQPVAGTSELRAVFSQVPVGRTLELQRHVVEGQDYVTEDTVFLEGAGEELTVELP